jgi:hypothetical protein
MTFALLRDVLQLQAKGGFGRTASLMIAFDHRDSDRPGEDSVLLGICVGVFNR